MAEKKARKPPVRTPVSDIMKIAGQIDRLLNKIPIEKRARVLAVVNAAQEPAPLFKEDSNVTT